MTDQDNKNTTRSTLTLKLKPSVAVDPSTLTLKQPPVENRRINKSSSVQVTIKGRKKDAKEEAVSLNRSEVEARFRAISSSKDSNELEDLDSTKILNKAIKEQKQAEIKEEPPVVIEEAPVEVIEIPEEVKVLANERKLAREAKDWAKSDELRAQINSLGYEIKDTDNGTKISKI
jgi:cysteinyl-tRNA synthetase